MQKKIAIIVLNYNNLKDTTDCVNSILGLKWEHKHEIIVVDNASTDHSNTDLQSRFPNINFVQNNVNNGYTGGNNLGIKTAIKNGCEFFLILNNDTVIKNKNSISKLIEMLDSENVGLCGFKQFNPENGKVSSNTNSSFFYSLLDKALNLKKLPSPYLSGFALGIKLSTIKKIGYLPESFFMYCEEIYYSYMARLNNIAIREIEDDDVAIARKPDNKYDKPYFWYYNIRNGLYFIKKLPLSHIYKLSFQSLLIIYQLKLLFTSRNRFINFKRFCLGIIDYNRNIAHKKVF